MSDAGESPQATLPDAVGIHPLRFLGVNCTVGPYHNPPPGYDWSPAALVRKILGLNAARLLRLSRDDSSGDRQGR